MGLGWKEKDIKQALQVLIPDKGCYFFQVGAYVLFIQILTLIEPLKMWKLAPLKMWKLALKSSPIRYWVLRLHQGKSFLFGNADQGRCTEVGHVPHGYGWAGKHCCLKMNYFYLNGP